MPSGSRAASPASWACCRLAGLLEPISEAQWDAPSLCEGWRVREVVAHMTMAARYPAEEFTARLRDVDFEFTRLSEQIARQDAELPTAELVDDLRSEVMRRWARPAAVTAAPSITP